MRHHRRRGRARCPRGFTIVELIVAMMIVALGVLSLVGANTVFVRRRNEARQRLAAVAAASNRVAQLSSGACRPAGGAAPFAFGIAEQWWVVLRGNATREIVDSVHFGARPGDDFVLRTRLPC